jgi:arabinogalactan endo-1,4-beta-galactosidase
LRPLKIKMKKAISQFRLFLAILTTLLIYSCSGAQTPEPAPEPNPAPTNFAFSKGADVGWLPQMEATGYKFYDADGTVKNCLQLLKDRGINTIRLRVWVNPSSDKTNGHCSPAETIDMAVRAKNMGMRIMIDFHYSDTWADPGHQTKPAAWASHTFEELKNDVYKHTYDVLNALKVAGVTPEWVQVGNEIPSGMLWPEGKIENNQNWNQLGALLDKGYEATKAIDSSIKVVIHIDQGNSNGRFRWFFDNITTQKVKYDVIGMSYYPYWLGYDVGKEHLKDYRKTIADLEFNLKDMVSRYDKEVMIVEVGGEDSQIQDTQNMLTAVIKAVKSVPNNKGLGVIYWEPQGARIWSGGYPLSAWQSNGKPSPALDAFKN